MPEPTPSPEKAYIGDGVYVAPWQDGFVLTTEDGIRVRDRIYVERSVWETLQLWANRNLTPKTDT